LRSFIRILPTICVEGAHVQKPAQGRNRVVIEEVMPQLDCGRHPVRRIEGDELKVTAAIYGDGHDLLSARLLYRYGHERSWKSVAMTLRGNDLWDGSFVVDRLGEWRYTIESWVDHFESWAADMRKRISARTQRSGDAPEAS